MKSYCLAYLAMKKGERNQNGFDEALVNSLIDALFSKTLPNGTGLFSRLESYAVTMFELIAEHKHYLSGNDEAYLAFVLGLEAGFESVARMAQRLKKRSN